MIWTIAGGILIAWLVIMGIPLILGAVVWMITAIMEWSPQPPRRPVLLGKALLPRGRKGVLVYALLYAALAAVAYFVLSHR